MQPDSATADPHDVRMRGFARRTTVEAAWEWVDGQSRRLGSELVPLDGAGGRVLASDVTSGVDVPGFDRSMMDGYALRADQTQGAGSYNRLELEIVGESLPGRPFAGTLSRGQAVLITTGAPI